MLKKAIASAAGLVVLGGLIFGTDLFSYLSTAGSSVKETVKQNVPLDFELKRARDLLIGIDPEISKSKKLVAEQQVEIEALETKIAQRANDVADRRTAVLTRSDQLKSGKPTFQISNVSYTRDQLEGDLKKRFESMKQVETTLEQEQKVLERKQAALEANRKKLENMVSMKKELELKIEELEARLHSVRAAEDVKNVAIDDSEFHRVRSLVDELDKQIKVRERVVDVESQPSDGLIPVDNSDASHNVLDEVDAYFGNAKTENVAAKE